MMWCAIFMVTFTWHVRNKNSMEHLGVLQTADSIYTIISHISVLYIVFHRQRWKKEIEVFSTPHLYVSTVVCRSIKISTCLSLSLSLRLLFSHFSFENSIFPVASKMFFYIPHATRFPYIYATFALIGWMKSRKKKLLCFAFGSKIRSERSDSMHVARWRNR